MIEIMQEISIREKCKIMSHIERKCEATLKAETKYEEEVYKDIYNQALREAGAYSLDSIDVCFLFAVHDAIDCYQLPQALEQKIMHERKEEGE